MSPPGDLHSGERRLQRVRIADYRDPAGPAPPRIVWAKRSTARIARDLYLIAVPCPNVERTSAFRTALSDALRLEWLPPGRGGWDINGVWIAFQSRDEPPGSLLMALSAQIQIVGAPPLDSDAMGADLSRTLEGVILAAPA